MNEREIADVRRRFGMLFQSGALLASLTVGENVALPLLQHSDNSADEIEQIVEEKLQMVGLSGFEDLKPAEISGGMKKRVGLARALALDPELLFLDEPTAGLDPQTRANLWDILRVLHAEGQTILLTTHYMEEAEALCEQVSVVDHGEVLASGTVNELKAGTGAETVITVRYDEPVPDGMAEQAGLGRRAGTSKVEADGDQVRVFTREPDGVLGELVTAGSAAGLSVLDATQLKPSLETVFLTLTGREYRE